VQNGKIMTANARYAEIVGYEPSELIGMEESQLVTPGLRGLVGPKINGPSGVSEALMKHKDGTASSVELAAQEMQYKGAPARLVRVLDISERAKFQEDREQLLKQLAGVSEELSALKQVSGISVNVAQPEMAMEALLRNLATIVRADSGMIMVRDGERLVARSVHGNGDKFPAGYSEEITASYPGRVVNDNQGVFVEDAQADPAVSEPLKAAGARSLMGVPIRQSSNIIGVLQVAWTTPHAQSDREMRLMEIAADRCASAIMASRISESSKASEDIGSMLSEINSQLSSSLKLGMPGNR